MEKIIFNCETITPMFLSGADGQTPELRAPSIKGALRFWWRAIQSEKSLEQLKIEEGAIFGDTQQRSKISIQVRLSNIIESSDILPQGAAYVQAVAGTTKSTNILEYLAYGVVPKSGKMTRTYIDVGSSFKIVIKCPEYLKKTIEELVEVMSIFGAIGARGRNGYGNFTVTNRNLKTDAAKLLFNHRKGKLKNYTSFSEQSCLFKGISTYDNWKDALFEVGSAYQKARLSLEDRHYGSQRKMIAQPLSIRDNRDGSTKIYAHGKIERNAKCFFIGITKEGDNFQGHILYLPHHIDGLSGYLRPNDALANELKNILKEVQ
ncbi:MAG: type III-B CRISPR module RAMP protein Cmr1 [Bacteroidota bacterium]